MANDPLHTLFQQTLDALSEMLGVLEAEAEALAVRDSNRLERLAQQKQELVPILERLAAAQRRQLGIAPESAIEAGIERYLAAVDADTATAIQAAWQAILDHTRACQRQNEHNGAYIGLVRRHVETSLDILQGPAHGTTYGRDGVKHRGGYGRRSYSV